MSPSRQKRATLLTFAAVLTLGLTACAGSTATTSAASTSPTATSPSQSSVAAPTPTPTPTPVDYLPADQSLVRRLYYDYSHSWEGGLRGGTTFIAQHNYPDFSYTPQECLTYLEGRGDTNQYAETVVPDVSKMALDAGWTLPISASRNAGLSPVGRVYIVPIQIAGSDPGAGYNNTSTAQVHVAVSNNKAYFFQACEAPKK